MSTSHDSYSACNLPKQLIHPGLEMLLKMFFDSFWLFFVCCLFVFPFCHPPSSLKHQNLIYFQIHTFSGILSVSLSLDLTNQLMNIDYRLFLRVRVTVMKSCVNIHCIEYCHMSVGFPNNFS